MEPVGPLGIDEILQLIPHRYPMLLVDRVLSVVPHKRIVGIKNVSANEPYFQGHFPGKPIVPGVIMMESIFQIATVLGFVSEKDMDREKVYLLAMDKVKFRKAAIPGDRMKISIDVLKIRGLIWSFKAIVEVEDELALTGEFIASFAKAQG